MRFFFFYPRWNSAKRYSHFKRQDENLMLVSYTVHVLISWRLAPFMFVVSPPVESRRSTLVTSAKPDTAHGLGENWRFFIFFLLINWVGENWSYVPNWNFLFYTLGVTVGRQSGHFHASRQTSGSI